MAPAYRNPNRRQNRTGYVDHDVLEGLPVRQWRRDYTTIIPPAAQENTPLNDIWAVELPHGMPKDSHLLPQHSQDLLRAARSGKIYKRPLPAEEEEVDVEAILGDKPEKKDDDPKDKGYTVKAWKPVPRHLEAPAIEYLAKRRKGLITAASKPAANGPTLTKATVKRIDAAGNEYVQDVVVPQGEKVEGEVISQTTIPDPNVVLGEGPIAPTPPKRKGPPKRKPKGPGRGRKKKPMAPTSVPQAQAVDGATQGADGVVGAVETDRTLKTENEGSATPMNNEDNEMADGSIHDSEDDEGEEGEEEDEEESVDNLSSPSKTLRPISTPPQDLPIMMDIATIEPLDSDKANTEIASHPATLQVDEEKSEIKSGSPLKNVIMTNSTLTSPLESPSNTTAIPFLEPSLIEDGNQDTEIAEPASFEETVQDEVVDAPPTILPHAPPEPTLVEEVSSMEVLKQEEEEEEILLDIVENANDVKISQAEAETLVPLIQEPGAQQPEDEQPEVSPFEPQEVPTGEAEVQIEEPVPAEPSVKEEGQVVAAQPVEEESDDGFPDLLGGLEKQLNEPIAGLPKEGLGEDSI